ncbi:fibronectin type III domain-containing protein [Aggregicoccus sp. 17bor-14]|uniref:hypothetical protein n=1 Tax=Myxococcaceae TaxID=31 RepID=UPI00129C98AC|nr:MULTISPECIES: hypothetical protein [Myxococcaceae]MBF5044631.1 hypothetical protein [Simulacricoccus sp. 17bor-14]MRI90375.1 fibronectin type III domain-containing protein [Aggregicoccus sp. 17bor-14]
MRSSRLAAPLCLALLLSACLPDAPARAPDAGTEGGPEVVVVTPDASVPPGYPDVGTPDAGHPDASVPPMTEDEVRVTNRVPYLYDNSERYEVLSNPVEVLVPAPDGGYTRLASTSLGIGIASVHGVPDAGGYLVRSGNSYVYTSARSVNRGWARLERQGVSYSGVSIEGSGPGVRTAELTLEGLSPWNEGGAVDDFEMVGLETGSTAQLAFNPQPATGATSVSHAPADIFPVTSASLPHFDPTLDTLTLVQRAAQNVGTSGIAMVARRAGTVAAPSVADSGPLRLGMRLEEMPQRSVTLDLRSSAFRALRAQVHPDAELEGMQFDVTPAAYGIHPEYGWVGYSGELFSYYETAPDAPDLAATFSYGNPYPSSWAEVGGASCLYRVRLTLPSGSQHFLYRSIGGSDLLANVVGAPIVPTLSPPTDLRVDGLPATASQTLASLTPTLSWGAPTTGTPTAYRLTLYRLTEPSPGTVSRTTAGQVDLPAELRSLRLPAGMLQPGRHYVFVVTAMDVPTWDLARRETQQRLPGQFADAVTGLLSAP